jgi:hypothetical protein
MTGKVSSFDLWSFFCHSDLGISHSDWGSGFSWIQDLGSGWSLLTSLRIKCYDPAGVVSYKRFEPQFRCAGKFHRLAAYSGMAATRLYVVFIRG